MRKPSLDEKEMQRRKALITGGAGGIGVEIARVLALDGYAIAVADLKEDQAKRVAAALPNDGHIGVPIDVSDEASV
jgi:NAD(P)-dependent dehydrogenase (short-subunit alcohol dehydrogenase family)